MADEFWLSEEQFGRLAPLLPTDTRGVARVDDWRVISDIVRVLISDGRWGMHRPAIGRRRRSTTGGCAGRRMGVWQRAFETLAAGGGPPSELKLNSTWAKAHRSATGRNGGGAQANAMGRSRGGRTTKLHALVDGLGRLVAFTITRGQRGDAPVEADLVSLLPASATLSANCAYDSDALRHVLIARGPIPVIPNGPRRKKPPSVRRHRLRTP